ncbi:TonB-linked outer membrane protein, SusC/RagA family [Galbibacter orientalis DSM 19592]|uniref:TonB-linked outer membrane protein, SusC/RagA family n=1 Tax=Galbibacter orientalis DSM 19592 TaxID=926559 RepID=I3C1B8_9FLAO|nr:TonB-dependent receptor [Galbibacter orientalis]EIJ37411.1 TonB-linked outer membrane protein, SusC/RagA family [Galbibacter orientalis DSM 19592]
MKSKIQKREKKLSFTRTIYLSLLTILSVWSSYANISEDEKVTLDSSNETLINILSSIENQTSVSFVYGDDVKQLHLKRSINYSNEPLLMVLNDIAKKFQVSYKKINKTIAISTNKVAVQEKQIKGTVTDNTGVPLMGVSVMQEGTANGVTTDFDGNFTINAPIGSTLVFTYVGMKTINIAVKSSTNTMSVAMEADQEMLDEVVVIGYGETSKETLIDAVNKVDPKSIEERPVSNAANALQGVSPGLNVTQSSGKPGSEPRLNIRGFTSINGGSPLIIVDGVEGDINSLNPNDIESISVLKDAGSSAIYGARGAFGVVLVTTKKAKKGNITVDVSNTTVISSPTINTDFVTDPYKAVTLVDEAFRTAVGRNYTGYTEADYAALLEVSKDPSKARVISDYRNGKLQYVHYGATDWWDTFFRDSYPSNITNVSISGGSDKVKSYFSYRNYQATGILKVQDDQYKQYNLRGKIDVEVNDWLTFSNNMQYNSANDVEHGGSQYGWRDVWGSLIWVHALPSYMPTNPDGSALWRTELNNYTVGDGVYASLLQGKSKQVTDDTEFSNIATAKLNPLPGFDITASYAIRKVTFNRYQRSTRIPYSIFVDDINTFGSDKLTEYNNSSSYNAFNIFGEYKKQLGNHSLTGMVGFNQENYQIKSIEASKQNSISDDLNSLGLATSNAETTGSASEWALQGLFYRFSYDFKKKYLIEFNGRYDGSSRFPEEHRWGFFPSVSAGWIVSKEDFFDGINDTFSLLKLRASYGSLGNQNISDYAYIPTLNKGINTGYAIDGSTLGYIESPGLNPNEITWEEVKTLNLGVDVGFFNNSLTAGFDWFQRDTDGMLTAGATLPSVLGTSSPQENAADLRTHGFELSLGYNKTFQVANSPFNFSITGTLSDSETIITRFDNPSNSLLDFYEGMTIGELWGYHIDGLFQSEEEIVGHADQTRVSNRIMAAGGLQPGDVRYVDLNGDGVINEGENTVDNPGDRRIIGNSAPHYLYSFKVSSSWKGFDISAFFQGVGQQDWYPNTDSRTFWAMYNRPYDSFIRKDLANNIWSPENPDAYFPRMFGYIALSDNDALGAVNDRYIQDISYLRLKNLTVGYTIPKNIIDRLPFTKFRIYFSGENLLTFSKLTDYIDPEAASNSVNLNAPSTSTNRSTAQTVPFSEIYSLGVSLQF